MFQEMFFFIYIFAGFVGLLTISLIFLMVKYRTSGNDRLLSSIRNFLICTALIDALYFYIEYTALKTGNYNIPALIRMADIVAFTGQIYFWVLYIREKSGLYGKKSTFANNMTVAGVTAVLVLSIVEYGFMMNDQYYIPEGNMRTAAVIIQLAVCMCITVVLGSQLVRGLSEIVQRKIRLVSAGISILIGINGTWNGIISIEMMTGKFDFETGGGFDPTAALLFLINALTVYLVYDEDFSALFTAGTGSKRNENNINLRLDFLAQAHMLTEREREILERAYNGLTNPEIAQELCISKYTVKRHMHNIFEKLDISTRMELVHYVNSQNGPGGPL